MLSIQPNGPDRKGNTREKITAIKETSIRTFIMGETTTDEIQPMGIIFPKSLAQ